MADNHISSSQIDMYLRCGRQHYYRYHCGIVVPPRGIMTTGTCIHTSAENNFKQKIVTGNDLPFDEWEGIFEQSMREWEQKTIWSDMLFDKALLTGSRAIRKYHSVVAPHIQPLTVEHEFRIPLTDDYDLKGVIDLVDVDNVVVDHKTGKKPKSQNDVDRSSQLSIYAGIVMQDDRPVEVRFDNIIIGDETKIKQLKSIRTRQDVTRVLNTARQVVNGIRNGIYLPADSGHWCCSPDWCGYWQRCHRDMEVNDNDVIY